VNTALDTCINLFLLERDGIATESVPYLSRQQSRIHAIMTDLNARNSNLPELPWNDETMRLACFLDWALFRQRVSLEPYPELVKLLAAANQHEAFVRTAPPKS